MRIIIEIEGADAKATVSGVEATGDSSSVTPPPDILRAAQRLGATSAGAAPAHPGAAVGGAVAVVETAYDLRASTVGDADAGQAPRAAAGSDAARPRTGARTKQSRRAKR